MEILGKVVAILDDTKVLLQLQRPVDIERVLTVFSTVNQPALQQLGLEEIHIPKGDVRIIAGINRQHFLAQRFQSEKIETRRKPSNFMLNPLSQFLEEEVEVITKGKWSAVFDKSQSLGIDYPKEIQVGDPVGTK